MTIKELVARSVPLLDIPVIDAHAHLGPFPMIYAQHADAAGLLSSMDQIGVRLTCISSSYAICADYRQGSDEVAAAIGTYRGRFCRPRGYQPALPGGPRNGAGAVS